MGFYNPRAPGIVGQEWVPIRYEPYPIPRGVEVGHGFRVTTPTQVTEALFYLDSVPAGLTNNQVISAAVYPRGREGISGPIHTNTPPLYTGTAANDATMPSFPWNSLYSPQASGVATLGPGTGFLDLSFAVPGVGPPAAARILEVSWSYLAAGPFGEIEAETIRVGIRNDAGTIVHWIADELNGPLTLAAATGYEVLSAGDTNVMWANPTVAMAESLPWRAADLNAFQQAATPDDLWLRIAAVDLPYEVQLSYIAMHIRWCAEERIAYGGTPYGPAMAGGVERVYQLDNGRPTTEYNRILLRDPAFVASPLLEPGDYTLTLTTASNGGVGANGETPTVNAIRQLYPMPDHPGVELTLAGAEAVSERNRNYHLSTWDNPFWLVTPAGDPTFEAAPTDVLPHVTLYDPNGQVLLGVHVYGRQTTRAPVQGNPVHQSIDVSVADGRPYPWLRFYARRLHRQAGIPLTVTWVVGLTEQVVAQLLPAEFEALPEITDGWREVNLRMDPVPAVFPGSAQFLVDTFTRTEPTGLGTADTGQAWDVVSGSTLPVSVDGTRAVFDFTGAVVSSHALYRVDGSGFSDVDYRVRMQTSVVGTYQQVLWIFAHSTSDLNDGYEARLRLLAGGAIDVEVARQDGGVHTEIDRVDTGMTAAPDTWYWLRFRVSVDPTNPLLQLLQAKAWEEGDPEPDWQVSGTSDNHPYPGYLALGALVFTPDGSAREMRIDSVTVVGAAQVADLMFTAPGLSRPEQWQVLGAEAMGDGGRVNWPATYGQPTLGAIVNFSDFFTPQPPGADAAVMLSQDPPQPQDLVVEVVELPLTPVGEPQCPDGGAGCVPTSVLYHQLSWTPVEYPEQYIVDIYNRTEVDEWGTANLGGTWAEVGGAAPDYHTTNLAVGVDAGVHEVTAGTGPRHSVIGTGIGDVDIRTLLYLADPTGVYGSGGIEVGVLLRWQDDDNHYHVRLRVADPDVVVQIVLVEGGVETVLVEQVLQLALLFDPFTYLRVQVFGDVIRAKVWAGSDAEPLAWPQTLAVADPTFTDGSVGLRSLLGDDVTTGPEAAYYIHFAATGVQESIFAIWGGYELQRRDTIDTDWRTIATIASPDIATFLDFEARIGVESEYRVRITNVLDFTGPWSDIAAGTLPAPGIGGSSGAGVLVFTSNARQDGSGALAYTMQWRGGAREGFAHPEVETQQLQRIFGKDYFTALRPVERGGQQFSRAVLVNNAAVAPPTLDRAFTSLRDLAWAQLPYVCVRTEQGDRWLANVAVPEGEISSRRRLQVAQVVVTQVTDTPATIASVECEGLVSLNTPVYAQAPYVHAFAAMGEGFEVAVLARMETWQSLATLAGQMSEPASGQVAGWVLQVTRGRLILEVREWTGTAAVTAVYPSDAPVLLDPGELAWVRVTWVRDNGGGLSQAEFATSTDAVTWTPVGSAVTAAEQPYNTPTGPLQVGAVQGVDALEDITTLRPAHGLTIAEALFYDEAQDLLASPNFAAQPAGTTLLADDQGNTWQLIGGSTCQR